MSIIKPMIQLRKKGDFSDCSTRYINESVDAAYRPPLVMKSQERLKKVGIVSDNFGGPIDCVLKELFSFSLILPALFPAAAL